MKKFLTLALSLAMVLTMSAPALAAEDPTVDYAAMEAQIDQLSAQIDELWAQIAPLQDALIARYDDYYEKYGDMDDWDEEMWALSSGWSEYEWNGYEAGRFAGGFGEDYWLEEMRALGMHFPGGVNLRVQWEFQAVEPIAQDGVSYYPADALLTALGVESTEIEIVDINGTACLPIRPVAEEQGYEVEWDSYYNVISLVNWDEMAAEWDEEFTIFNEILKASMNTVDPAKTYESKAKLDYILTAYGEGKDDSAKLSVDMNALLAGDYSIMDMDATLGVDLTDVEDLLRDFGGQAFLDEAEALDGAKYSMMLDGAGGGVYFKGSNLSRGNEFLPDDAWIGMADEAFGADYMELMGQMREMTLGKLMVLMLQDSYAPYETLGTLRPMMTLLFGDDAFTTTKSGSTTTYTAKMDMVKLAARGAKLGLFTLEDLTGVFGENSLPVVNYSFTAKVAGEKLTAMTMKGKLAWSALTLEMDISSTETTSEVYMAIKGRYLGKLECKGTSTVKPTTKALPVFPAEHADYQALMAQYYESLWGDWYDEDADAVTYPLDPENYPVELLPGEELVVIPSPEPSPAGL